MKQKNLRRTALCGALAALALGISYLETLLPLSIGIPGAKLGLANLVTVYALYAIGAPEAGAVLAVRILLSALLFSGPLPLLYSAAGGLCSFLIMWLLRRTDRFGVIAVSCCGGAIHNLGQLCVAAIVLGTAGIGIWLPYLIPIGILTGGLNGFAAWLLLKRFPTGTDTVSRRQSDPIKP